VNVSGVPGPLWRTKEDGMVDLEQQPAAHILIVDDYADSREMYAEMLSSPGTWSSPRRMEKRRSTELRKSTSISSSSTRASQGRRHHVIRSLRSRPPPRMFRSSRSRLPWSERASGSTAAGGDLSLDKPCCLTTWRRDQGLPSATPAGGE